MNEFDLIRRFFSRGTTDDSIIVGTGDDGAVTRCDDGHELVTVIDTLVADVHFPSSMRPRDIGYRAVAVNLSDMAAMGAKPRWMTLALTLDSVDIEWLDGFSRGLYEAADEFSVSLIGGDTTSGTQIVVSVQMSGEVERSTAITRGGAQPGDDIYVSGTIGDAAMGLSLLQNRSVESAAAKYLVARFARPSPRTDLGRALRGVASAAIDMSDGLFADASKLLDKSGVAAVIEVDKLPLSQELQVMAGDDDARTQALSGGDDYELCFTAPAEERQRIVDIAADLDLPITRIGCVHAGSGLSCTVHGDVIDYVDTGYSHF